MKAAPDFFFAKNMSMGSRFTLIALLAAIGIVLQLFASFIIGWLLIFTAVLLGGTSGKSNEPHVIGAGKWENVTTEEIEEARKLIADAASVGRSNAPFYLGSFAGCGLVAMLVIGVIFVAAMLGGAVDYGTAMFLPVAKGGSVSALFVVDALTLLLPMWILGRVTAWKPPNLEMRLKQIWGIYGAISSDPKLEFQPSLRVAKAKEGSVPMDVRLMVKIKDSDPDFLGIQIQTSINHVQSKSYPYTYCVLIAKPKFRLIEKAKQIIELPPPGGFTVGLLGLFGDTNERKEAKFPRLDDAVVETKREGDVEIAVVRQGTGGSGYTTSPEQAYRVFTVAYGFAIKLLA